MAMQLNCRNVERRKDLLKQSPPILNGIDYIEIASADQKTLAVHFLFPLPGQTNGVPNPTPVLSATNILIAGGVRVRGIRSVTASAAAEVLRVTVNACGDFSTYTLQLVTSSEESVIPAGFDPQTSSIEFSFKVECPSDFDCAPASDCPPQQRIEPAINYLAKDYETFRQLMLDRMAVVMPSWTERNAADIGIALVETLAYAADYLSYYQDAVATEAFLGTARRRVSVRQHARLLDYHMQEGVNARAWVSLQVDLGSAADTSLLSVGTQLVTKLDTPSGRISDVDAAVRAGALVFETLTDVRLYSEHNQINFYTWDDQQCCLPKGATAATLAGDFPNLSVGDVLIVEEILSQDGGPTLAPTHRQAVRLTNVTRPLIDPLINAAITEIEWSNDDALTFPLCVSSGTSLSPIPNVSVLRGNIVLADHGQTLVAELLDVVPDTGLYLPRLKRGPVTQQAKVVDARGSLVAVDPSAPAAAAMQWDADNTLPDISVEGEGETWFPLCDLLSSSRFETNFVVETEDDGTTSLRFGDNTLGRAPAGGSSYTAKYRIGNGTEGNVGAEAIAYVVSSLDGISRVRNPLPSMGGADPESIDQVRLYAPQAFRIQERAVTEADYAEVAQRNPQVQRAVATLRWTGSWHTMFVTVDRKGTDTVDAAFEAEMMAFFDHYRLAGYDIEVEAPEFVPLDIVMSVCAMDGYFQADVEAAILAVFSNQILPNSQRGFFYADNFTFGQALYLSQIVSTAMQVPGVHWVDVSRFQRWGEIDRGELGAGVITMSRLEIARLDNDPSLQENGRIEFAMRGGI